MRFCSLTHECLSMCDMCKFFSSDWICTNPESEQHGEPVYPTDDCDEFYCYMAAREDETKAQQATALLDVTDELTKLWVEED